MKVYILGTIAVYNCRDCGKVYIVKFNYGPLAYTKGVKDMALPPTKNTFVCTSQTWSTFHTAMTFNAIKSVFVASSTATQH